MAPDPSPRAIGTERGCVEDQPQRVGSSKASRACSVLRLVEDDTAALRSNSAGVERAKRQKMPDRIRTPAKFNRSTPARSPVRTRIRCEWPSLGRRRAAESRWVWPARRQRRARAECRARAAARRPGRPRSPPRPSGRRECRRLWVLEEEPGRRAQTDLLWEMAFSRAAVLGRAQFEHHRDAAVRLVLRFGFGHRHGVTVAGDSADLAGGNAVLEQLASRRTRPV